ncbi:uncharacterized protein METZ01_LOCUS424957, partial [marine metagenome]
ARTAISTPTTSGTASPNWDCWMRMN